VYLRGDGIPTNGELGVLDRLDAGAAEFAEEFGGGVVGEAKIEIGEGFVENRGPEEAGHLLLFDGVVRSGDDVTAAGENGAGHLAFVRREEGELAGFEGEVAGAAAKLDAV